MSKGFGFKNISRSGHVVKSGFREVSRSGNEINRNLKGSTQGGQNDYGNAVPRDARGRSTIPQQTDARGRKVPE